MPLRFFAAAVVSFAAFFFAAQAGYGQSNSEPGIAQRHAQHLRYGINLSEWFAQVYDAKGYTKEHFDAWTTAQDIGLIKSMGFDHVRLSVNPQPMFRRGQADRIPADYLGYLDSAVQMILARGLAVIIDVHPDSDFKQKLVTD
ncbi:MAG TPA: cellulase family glycosylhydrolase, partial [Candidatus Acidoferrum sp.]|nr:cellulase family glycosylhydrolase [Candidatus Acidoferrum sp.]